MHLRKCNLCGGKVEFIDNSLIYGKSYGSGKAYRCTKCGAYVGTHKNNPHCPLGILADEEMQDLRRLCHALFDSMWSNGKERSQEYKKLADKLGISYKKCHFGMFDKEMLKKAINILKEEENG